MDSQNDITQPDNPLYWPKGAVKDLSQDEPKEKDDLDELELLQKNPLISNQIIHKRVPGKNLSKSNLIKTIFRILENLCSRGCLTSKVGYVFPMVS